MLICFQLFLVDNEDPKMFSLDCLNSDQSDGDSLDKISISQRPPLLAPDPDVLVFYYFFDTDKFNSFFVVVVRYSFNSWPFVQCKLSYKCLLKANSHCLVVMVDGS